MLRRAGNGLLRRCRYASSGHKLRCPCKSRERLLGLLRRRLSLLRLTLLLLLLLLRMLVMLVVRVVLVVRHVGTVVVVVKICVHAVRVSAVRPILAAVLAPPPCLGPILIIWIWMVASMIVVIIVV